MKNCVLVRLMAHSARRAKALGLHYEARLRGLKLCAINLTSTENEKLRTFQSTSFSIFNFEFSICEA
jgi:hypothetical protein